MQRFYFEGPKSAQGTRPRTTPAEGNRRRHGSTEVTRTCLRGPIESSDGSCPVHRGASFTCRCVLPCARCTSDTARSNTSGTCTGTATPGSAGACRSRVRSTAAGSRRAPSKSDCRVGPRCPPSPDRGLARSSWATRAGTPGPAAWASPHRAPPDVRRPECGARGPCAAAGRPDGGGASTARAACSGRRRARRVVHAGSAAPGRRPPGRRPAGSSSTSSWCTSRTRRGTCTPSAGRT
ncbi:unnamed protein product [Ixodes persulcatus]